MGQVIANHLKAEAIDGQVAQAMLRQSPECIKLIDSDGHLRFMSENGLSLMEIDDFAMVEGAFWWDLWPEEARLTLRSAVDAARRGVSVCFDAACPTAKGSSRHWRVRVSQICGGSLNGMILSASQDITDEVAEEDARRQLSADNEAMRRFTRFIAHDLRGPVRHHKLLAEMIEDAPDAAEAAVLAGEIKASAHATLQLLAGLEALHAVDDHKSAPVPVSLADIIADARALTNGADIDLHVDGDDGAPPILATRGQIVSVFSNLLENAVKYHEGPGKCRVEIAVSAANEATTRITVQDNGPGLAADRAEDIFKPLVRQSNSVGKPGSGLGLALADRIISSHGGRISALPRRLDGASGACFVIDLPHIAPVHTRTAHHA